MSAATQYQHAKVCTVCHTPCQSSLCGVCEQGVHRRISMLVRQSGRSRSELLEASMQMEQIRCLVLKKRM